MLVLHIAEQAGHDALAFRRGALNVRQGLFIRGRDPVGVRLEAILEQLGTVVEGDLVGIAQVEARSVLQLQAPSIGLKTIAVRLDAVVAAGGGIVTGIPAILPGRDEIQLGLQIDQVVVWAVAVIERGIPGVEITAAGTLVIELPGLVVVVGPGVLAVGVGFHVVELQALVVGQVQAQLEQLRTGDAAGLADLGVQPVLPGFGVAGLAADLGAEVIGVVGAGAVITEVPLTDAQQYIA
ncbi:hypothetical protein D3C80_841240 [compost metagenome]